MPRAPESRGAVGEQPFPDGPLVAPDPRGRPFLTVVDRARYDGVVHVVRIGLDRDTLWAMELPYEPRILTEGVVDSVLSARYVESFMRSGGYRSEEELLTAFKDAMHWPPHLPPVTRALGGTDGSVVLEMARPAESGRRFLVVDRNGALREALRGPREGELVYVDPPHVWFHTTDALDVDYLVRYRVEERGDGNRGAPGR